MSYDAPPPILERIAQCESEGRQFNDDGSVLISKTGDHGLFQISYIHKKEALNRGWNIDTIEGNTFMALLLYSKHGTQPWNSSRQCWEKYEKIPDISA